MKVGQGRWCWLVVGVLLGVLLTVGSGLLVLWKLPGWLVVDQSPRKADAIVVLGGGREGRLKQAVRLYDDGFAPLLILVGDKPADWNNLIRRHCPECDLDNRQHVMLNGSVSTMTDARLSHVFVRDKNLHRLLVITDPYHSRRTDFVFAREFADSDVQVQVCSSGDFGNLQTPSEEWWQDQRTLEYVWLEFGKILYGELLGTR